jgi:predicted deacylase
VIDVHLDFHSGTDRPTVDYVYIWTDEALSRSFGSTVLYRPEPNREGTTFTGTTKVVTIDRRNIPVVVVELGGGIVDQKPYVERGLAGLLNMLRQLGIMDGEVVPPPKQTVVRAIKTVRPTQGGLLETLAPSLGQTIKRGQVLGRIVSPYTFEVLEEIPTPYDNGVMILSHLSRNLVEAGDYAYMVGDLDGSEG